MSLDTSAKLSLLVLVASFCTLRSTLGVAVIEIKFLNYTDQCREDGGLSKCDPEFTLCLDKSRSTSEISPCSYGSAGESGFFADTNFIDFSYMTNIKGISNPWIITTNKLDSTLLFVFRVRDDDYFGDDHLQTWGTYLREPVHPSKNNSVWRVVRTSSSSYTLWFQIRIYCAANYYTSNCSQYCSAVQQPLGHFMCDPNTLNKKCLEGWTGENCTENINECSMDVCAYGTCVDLPGDYVCQCPPYYSGKNCTTLIRACESKPCKNGANCTDGKDFSYNCTCVGNWEGDNCDIKLNPCKTKPCENGMECVASLDHSNYTCNCSYPYSGRNCEVIISSTSQASTAVLNSTQTYTTSPFTKPMSTTAKLTTTKNGNETGGFHTGGAMNSERESGSFQYWHGIIIGIVVLLIIIIIIILILIVRRNRRKKEILVKKPAVLYTVQDNLAFENNMYNDVKRNPSGKQEKGPLPTTPSEDEQFVAMMPVFTPNSADCQDATCGTYTELDMDVDGYEKPRASVKDETKHEVVLPLKNERAERNPYADFSTLTGNTEKQPTDEVHYHDLDEMAVVMKNLDAAVQEHDLAPDTDGSHGYKERIKEEMPYNDVPSNIPVGFSDFLHFPGSPQRDEVFEDPFVSVPVSFNKESPYAEPSSIVEHGTHEPEGHHSATENGHYAELELNIPRISDPFASEISDEEDLPDFGLPQISPSVDGGYATPKGSQHGHCPLKTQESHYDTPSSNQPSNRSSANSSAGSLDSAMTHNSTPRPPVVPPKPVFSGSIKSQRGDLEQGIDSRVVHPPVPPKPSVRHGNNNVDVEDYPVPISIKEGYTLQDSENANIDDSTKSDSNWGLYLENHGFSNT